MDICSWLAVSCLQHAVSCLQRAVSRLQIGPLSIRYGRQGSQPMSTSREPANVCLIGWLPWCMGLKGASQCLPIPVSCPCIRGASLSLPGSIFSLFLTNQFSIFSAYCVVFSVCVCRCACLDVSCYEYVHTHIYAYTCVYTCIHTRTLQKHTYIHACMHMCVCTNVSTYINI